MKHAAFLVASAVTVALASTMSTPAGATASPARADDTPSNIETQTAVIDGHEFGPKDGLEVDTESFIVTSGGGPVGKTYGNTSNGISPMATWGSSYAYSTEIWQFFYKGQGRAAGNVYGGKRIVKVCFWWTRGGKKVSGTKCSSAKSTGHGWGTGPEAVGTFNDTLGSHDPKTKFHIKTTRINPNVH